MNKAFILGAGLGTRLRPMTDHLPKPLVPLFHKSLAEWAMAACARVGVGQFAINTHHLPEAWRPLAGAHPGVRLFHEPVLLETGGGLKNIADWIGDDPLLVHNGDVFSTLPLERLIEAHEASGLPVTLALRSQGPALHMGLDGSGTRVTDIRGRLGRDEGTHLFTGIYCVNPGFLDGLPAGEKVSVIPAFLELAGRGELGAVVIDDGEWWDLGDRAAYLRAHRELALGPAVHPGARVEPGAVVEDSVIGEGVVIPTGAVVRRSVVWSGARIDGGARLDGCIVCGPGQVTGSHQGEDLADG